MKTARKRMPKIIMLLVALTLFVNCEEKKKENPEEEHEDPVITKPDEVITLDEARTLYKTYDDRRVTIIQKYEDDFNRKNGVDKKFDVARYVNFDYKTIKDYIAYIEKEAEDAKVDISSLRIYFANNPVKDTSLTRPRQNSVMLSPTTIKKGEESLFYIDDSVKESPKAVLLNYDFTRKDTGKMDDSKLGEEKMEASVLPSLSRPLSNSVLTPFQDIKSLTLNRGNSAPPPYQ